MADVIKSDKQKDSLAALKNANTHLNEVFKKMSDMDYALGDAEKDLRAHAAKLGAINIEVYHEGKWVQRGLGLVLVELAGKLNKVRM